MHFIGSHPWLSFFSLLIISLLLLRFLGEQEYAVEPQASPKVAVFPHSRLYRQTNEVLAAEDNTDSQQTIIYPSATPRLAMLSRVYLADQADYTLDVQYYLFHNDETGRAILAALMQAAERGVKVRLLLDDMDTPGLERYLVHLANAYENLQVRIFNPFYLRRFRPIEFIARFPRVTRRMHNKSYTVDNIATLVGGRNVGNEYFDILADVSFSDFDVLVAGSAVPQFTQAFNKYWYSGLAFNINEISQAASDKDYQHWQRQASEDLVKLRKLVEQHQQAIDYYLASNQDKRYLSTDTQAVYDSPDKVISRLFERDKDNMTHDILAIMKSAQRELWISSPYFIPGKEGMRLLRHLRERNVAIHILTNSYASNDVPAVHAAYMQYRKPLLEIGVKLYELQAPANNKTGQWSFLGSKNLSLHAKSLIVDREKAFVGSFNLDPRSAIHNTEMGVVFNNRAYGDWIVEKVEQFSETQAYILSLNTNSKLQWSSTVNGKTQTTTKEPDVGPLDKAVLTIIKILPVAWLL